MCAPFEDWEETAAEVAPHVNPWHKPRVEEYAPGREMLVCTTCDEAWPCAYERDLARDETY